MLTRNVVDATAPPRGKPREIKTLTPEEVERLLAVAQESEYYPAIFTALWTGMRRSELLGLRWRDVDLVLGTINVAQVRHRLRGGRTVYEELKSRMGKRAISMPPSLTIMLREQRARQEAVRECLGQDLGLDDLIFTWPDGRPMLPNSFSHAFLRIRRKAGLDVRLHDTRRTHASLLLREGVHQKVVQERLGHSSIAITSDIYSHHFPGMQEEAADKFDRALAGFIPKGMSAEESEPVPLRDR